MAYGNKICDSQCDTGFSPASQLESCWPCQFSILNFSFDRKATEFYLPHFKYISEIKHPNLYIDANMPLTFIIKLNLSFQMLKFLFFFLNIADFLANILSIHTRMILKGKNSYQRPNLMLDFKCATRTSMC